jgi:hypothetical protein
VDTHIKGTAHLWTENGHQVDKISDLRPPNSVLLCIETARGSSEILQAYLQISPDNILGPGLNRIVALEDIRSSRIAA